MVVELLPFLRRFLTSRSAIDRSYMVDAHDQDKMEASRNELHNLLDKPQLAGIPVLVLGNKRDLAGALDEKELIDQMCVRAQLGPTFSNSSTDTLRGRA